MFSTKDEKIRVSSYFRVYNKHMRGPLTGYTKIYEHYCSLRKSRKKKVKGKWSGVVKRNISFVFDSKIINEIKNYAPVVDAKSPLPPGGKVYLDYGCGDGQTMGLVSDVFRPDEKYCVDIDDHRHDKSGKFFRSINDIKNKSIDLITSCQVLHHVDYKLEKNVSALVNKLKPGGILIIREHDAVTKNHMYNIIVEHMLFDIGHLADEKKEKSFDEIKTFVDTYHTAQPAWYFSKKRLVKAVLRNRGMKLLHYKYKIGRNNTRIYNAVFKKMPPGSRNG